MSKLIGETLQYPKEQYIHELFEEQVLINPGQLAIAFRDERITYYQLNEKANRIAHYLIQQGYTTGCLIGIFMDRSVELIASMLAVLKIGAAYLPIDIEQPTERVNNILEQSKANCVLTNRYKEHLIREPPFLNLNNLDLSIYPSETIEPGQMKANTAAYVIYTSGSTGEPKGVVISHEAVINFIFGINEELNFVEHSVTLAATSVSFDIFVLESLLPLCIGQSIALTGSEHHRNPKLLARFIETHNVEIIQATPTKIRMLLSFDEGKKALGRVRKLLIGGEVFPAALFDELESCTHARIFNMYGPSETTVWSTYVELTDKESISIGKPLPNTNIHILNEHLQPVSDGVVGEIFISGEGLAMHYLHRPDLTKEKFLIDPLNAGTRIYRTGDIAKIENGLVWYLGRVDNQVKIRGHRIELGEIESKISSYRSIRAAVVVVKEDNAEKTLHAFYESSLDIETKDLRDYLSCSLIDAMIPQTFVRVSELPQTISGKIDRNSLLNHPELNPLQKRELGDKQDIVMDKLIQLLISEFSTTLLKNIIDIEIDEELHNVGIDSINFIKMIVIIEEAFEIQFDDEMLDYNKVGTLNQLRNYISLKLSENEDMAC